jgi:hypothetical protein
MPIRFEVDHERRVVFAEGTGRLTDHDVFGYQREVWSRADVRGYHELIDVSGVESIEPPTPERVRELAELSATMDSPGVVTRLAIVATTTLAFGLGKMFQALRDLQKSSTKEVGVFRTRQEAMSFLGLPVSAAMRDPRG